MKFDPAARLVRPLLGMLVALAAPSWAAPAADVAGDDDEMPAGLIARFERPEGGPIVRVDSRVAAHGRWSTIDRRLPDDAGVRVTWSGRLKVQIPGEYRLLVHGKGTVRIGLADQPVIDESFEAIGWHASQPLALEFGDHPFEVRYSGSENGAQISLFWFCQDFGLEPIGPRQFVHPPDPAVDREPFVRGETLVRSLRCAGCHTIKGETPLLAPALDRLSGELHRDWLVDRLTAAAAAHAPPPGTGSRMPSFALSGEEAGAVAAYLLASRNSPPPFKPDDQQPFPPSTLVTPQPKSSSKARPLPRKGPDAKAGERLAWTVGCVACHTLDDAHPAQPFDGGDLRTIARKRPANFFSRWLADPSSLNIDRRMPEFELTGVEREDLSAYLATLGATTVKAAPAATPEKSADPSADVIEQGREIFLRRQCVACHRGPGFPAPRPSGRAGALGGDSRWDASCLGEPDPARGRPGYRLAAADRAAIRTFAAAVENAPLPRGRRQIAADTIIQELGCLACHSRDQQLGLAARLPDVARRFNDLAPMVPAMTPPSLTSIGDKLHDPALAGAITRLSGVHRPYLMVRMPRFRLTAAELDMIIYGLTATDRIPEGAPLPTASRAAVDSQPLTDSLVRSAGGRLVTPDGFGCTSCHSVGKVQPPPGPLAARGPSLSKLEARIRRSWFDRFVRSPVRIVPRMEMPSVQLAVRGVLDERLDRQLDAVWQVLNLPDFEPPEPNPVQTLRRSGIAANGEPAAVVTDLVQADDHLFIKPMLIGLPNRHNLLFDFETNRLMRWATGDVGRQRAKGKGWHWEAAGSNLLPTPRRDSEIVLVAQRTMEPLPIGQFPTEPDGWRHLPGGGVELEYRLRFQVTDGGLPTTLRLRQAWFPRFATAADRLSGFERRIIVEDVPANLTVRWRAADSKQMAQSRRSDDRRTLMPQGGDTRWTVLTPQTQFDDDGTVAAPAAATDATRRELTIAHLTTQPVDQFPAPPAPKIAPPRPVLLKVAPGFEVVRLPLPVEQMPTALAWRPQGELVVASLKGRVWLARDTDQDGIEDELKALSDELSAPFGLAARQNFVDVCTKYAIVRLHVDDGDGVAARSEIVASGWGHTGDYHDWTTGLPSDSGGAYYIGLACQQDKRAVAAANLRGTVVKLVPRSPTPSEPRRYDLQPLSGGHRFPVGLALNSAGDLFVTDNQGNYNPFNEINHVRPGLRFGFINSLELKPDFKPPTEEPAINLPHPWTRSVNGIAFLQTPAAVRARLGRSVFGPLEGHLIGCEYDTRRLIRMSLRRVGDTYQGAAYPLSVPAQNPTDDFLGPLCAAISPAGDLYVGGIRDSGWGAGNNIGEIVRLRCLPEELPTGIAELFVERGQLQIGFTRPVHPAKATDPRNYAVESYRREATPAYGGPDLERRAESIRKVEVSDDGLQATLDLGPLREGFVYELRTKPLVAEGQYFPAEAYLTVRGAKKP